MAHFLWDHYIRFNKINWKICSYLYAIQNKKMFQRVFIVFPWDYPTNYKLWSWNDRVMEGQNSTFSKIFFCQCKLIHITRQKWISYVIISTFIFYHVLPSQDWYQWHTLSHKRLHFHSVQNLVVTVSQMRV